MRKLFGTDGIRGIAGKELSAELAFKAGNAISSVLGSDEKILLIAKDTRVSCDMLESAAASGASACGMNVLLCGIMPTPSLAMLTRINKAIGLMISASHNSYEYNGLKVISEGFKLPDQKEEEIEDVILSGSITTGTHHKIGRISQYPQARGEYLRQILGIFDGLDLSGIKIVFDGANGASYSIMPEILLTLGAEVTIINDSPDGFNINLNCGSQYLEGLKKKVISLNADLGIAHDGDADRCLMVDRAGKYIDGDRLMGISACYYKRAGILKNNLVISTVMSNLGLEVFLKSKGIELLRARVGDRYVLEKMLETSSVLGGEQSGHIIFLDKSSTGDGIITALTTIVALKFFNKDLKDIAEEIPRYPQIIENVKVEDKDFIMESQEVQLLIEKIRKELGEKGRIVLRPSGTEPLIRIMLEGEDQEKIGQYALEMKKLVNNIDA